MKLEGSIRGIEWGGGICQYIKICHTLALANGENYFAGINGPVGIGKEELLKQISSGVKREFISVDYTDFIQNNCFIDMCKDKMNCLFYIGNTRIENGVYHSGVELFMETLHTKINVTNSIFVFSSNAILGTNQAMSAKFRMFLYGSLSVQEKLSYAKTAIEKCQKKWGLETVYLPDQCIEILIKHYTKEAGVNYLTVLINDLYKTIYYESSYDKEKGLTITNKLIFRILGSGCYVFDEQIRKRFLTGSRVWPGRNGAERFCLLKWR